MGPTADGSLPRFQLALRVGDLDAAVAFYAAALGVPPAKRRPGYANFAVAEPPLKLVLLEGEPDSPTALDHLGVEVASTDDVAAETTRLAAAGLPVDVDEGTVCCYAAQDKVRLTDPGGAVFEVYTVLADAPPEVTSPDAVDGTCCDDGCCGGSCSRPVGAVAEA